MISTCLLILAFFQINCVIVRDFNDDEVLDFVELTKQKNVHVRFIEYMPFGGNKWSTKKLVPYSELVLKIRQRYGDFRMLDAAFNETSKVNIHRLFFI